MLLVYKSTHEAEQGISLLSDAVEKQLIIRFKN